MGIPILSVRDDQGNIIPIPAIQGRDGVDGKDGKDGKDGAAGPNLINMETPTPISGILMGAYGHVQNAIENINYLGPSAVTTDAVYINLLDGHVVASAVIFKARSEKWLVFGGINLDVTQATNGAVSDVTKMIYPPSGYSFAAGQIITAYHINTSGAVTSIPLLESTTEYFSVTTYTGGITDGTVCIPAFMVQLTQ